MDEILHEIHPKKLVQLAGDHKMSARAINLNYVSDSKPGITRIKKGKGFTYFFEGKSITDPGQLDRIRSLVIPPAWTNVWICPTENGHIQATGLDARNRKQYLYHKSWGSLRNQTKYHQLIKFGSCLPSLRKQVSNDLRLNEMNEKKVIATAIAIMDQTYIRIGSKSYEKVYGSRGVSTLKDKNVEVNGSLVKFSFTGKKSIQHNITLRNKKLARAIKQCRDIPGKELFQYYDEGQNKRPVDSGMINNYIKECIGEFTAKHFRTWAGSLHALKSLLARGAPENGTDSKKNIVDALDEVSEKLGNSRSICRKYYVHPGILKAYEEGKLEEYCRGTEKTNRYLEKEECMLLTLLKQISSKNRQA